MLLLSQLWQDPIDQQILCRLLCCSSAMASLVHRTCSGRVHVAVKMLAIAPGREQWLGRWLAKHASLLHSLWLPRRIQDLAPHCEECIAAGLSAAAGPSSLYRSRFTRSQASAAAAVACVTAASVDASLSSSPPAGVAPPRQAFLLQRLVCLQPSSGPILCSLAGSTQLTRLEVILTVQAAAQPACQQALASLTGLRELKLSQLVALSSPRRTSQMAFGKLVQVGWVSLLEENGNSGLLLVVCSISEASRRRRGELHGKTTGVWRAVHCGQARDSFWYLQPAQLSYAQTNHSAALLAVSRAVSYGDCAVCRSCKRSRS